LGTVFAAGAGALAGWALVAGAFASEAAFAGAGLAAGPKARAALLNDALLLAGGALGGAAFAVERGRDSVDILLTVITSSRKNHHRQRFGL
jgi:hypothetical protein